MKSDFVQAIIWCLVFILFILIVVRIYLVGRLSRKKEYFYGHSMNIGTRDVQEDCLSVKENRDGVMAILADGMGKAYGGSISSTIAVETALGLLEKENAFMNPQYFFQNVFRSANRRILDQLDEGSGAASVSIALIHHMNLYYAAVGNVQIAVFRRGELIPVTEGHTVDILARRKYLQGSITKQKTISLLREHRLYNYIGQDEFREIELFDAPIKLRNGDFIILMSDGIYETLPFAKIEEVLRSGNDCMQKANRITTLVEATPGDKNNGSIVLVAV